MNLSRPIIFIDIEATGADALRDRIVEIALVKLNPGGAIEEKLHRVNPGVRIPSEVIAIHGITNEAVANSPTFRVLAPELLTFIDQCDFGGFGICRFDIPLLTEEFRRAGYDWSIQGRGVLDGLTIYHQKERRDLSAAYQFYCGKTLEGAHGARADALASMEVLLAQVNRYDDLPRDVVGLHGFCNKQDDRFVDSGRRFIWRDGEAAINFGKHKGVLLRTLVNEKRDYVQWMVTDGKFPQDVVDICWKALRGEFPACGKSSDSGSASQGAA
jgi:DNA polymerase III subunit epsilon